MTLPASGPIAFSDIAAELGRPNTPLSFSDADVLALVGKAANQPIALTDFYGKSATPPKPTLDQMFGASTGTDPDGDAIYVLADQSAQNYRSPGTPSLQAFLNFVNLSSISSQPITADGISLQAPLAHAGAHNTRVGFSATATSVFETPPGNEAVFEYNRTQYTETLEDLAFANMADEDVVNRLRTDFHLPADAIQNVSVSLVEEDTRREVVFGVVPDNLVLVGDQTFNVPAAAQD